MKKLFICGFGLMIEDISIKTINKIKNSDLIISCAIEKNIFSSKNFENVRNKEPDKIADIIKQRFKNHNTISFITYDNPIFLNIITHYITQKIKNIKIEIIPSLSSFDYLFSIFNNLNLLKNDVLLINTPQSDYKKNFYLDKTKDTIIFGAENLSNRKIFEKFKDSYVRTY